MSEPKYRDEEWLREQYVEKGKTQTELSELCGCSQVTISRWVEKYNLSADQRTIDSPRLKDESWLREKYEIEGMSSRDIADECGCSRGTVVNRLKEHQIRVEDKYNRQYPRLNERGWLFEEYVEKKRTISDIAKQCSCAPMTVWRWLRAHKINTRAKTYSGSDHWNWSGGAYPYGPGWNETKRRQVRERDGYECVDCGTTQDEHKSEHDQALHVHHLIKARDVDDPEERNAVENLVTLCRDCHREWERLSEAGIRPQIDGVTAD